MKRTLLAAAVLSAAVAAQAEQSTQTVYPYPAPVTFVPFAPIQLQVDEDLFKAYVEYQQQAYAHFLAYQQQARESTPAFLRIPAVPQVPTFDAARMESLAARDERMRDQFRSGLAKPLQPTLMAPSADIEQSIAAHEQQLEAALAAAQKRLDARQKELDATAEKAKTL